MKIKNKYLIGTQFSEDEMDQKSSFNSMRGKYNGKNIYNNTLIQGIEPNYKKSVYLKNNNFEIKNFQINKNNKYDYNQHISDFLDEDDIGDVVIGENILTKRNNSNKFKLNTNSNLIKNELVNIIINQNNIGIQILTKFIKKAKINNNPIAISLENDIKNNTIKLKEGNELLNNICFMNDDINSSIKSHNNTNLYEDYIVELSDIASNDKLKYNSYNDNILSKYIHNENINLNNLYKKLIKINETNYDIKNIFNHEDTSLEMKAENNNNSNKIKTNFLNNKFIEHFNNKNKNDNTTDEDIVTNLKIQNITTDLNSNKTDIKSDCFIKKVLKEKNIEDIINNNNKDIIPIIKLEN